MMNNFFFKLWNLNFFTRYKVRIIHEIEVVLTIRRNLFFFCCIPEIVIDYIVLGSTGTGAVRQFPKCLASNSDPCSRLWMATQIAALPRITIDLQILSLIHDKDGVC